MRLALVVTLAAVLAGCAKPYVAREETFFPRKGTLIPNSTLQLSPSVSIALEKIVGWGALAGVAYLVLDPLAPNWDIEEAPLGDEHVHFSLKMKRYYAGGSGEARALFHRRAKEIVRLNDCDGYEVVEYNESMDSSVIGSRRLAEGVIRLTRKKADKQA